jgi:CheY-like chemotaxis protein
VTTKLLAIDDSKTMRKVLEITFSGDTYEVLLAENAQQALEQLRSEGPALALIDANLGSAGGGYELCQQIKREAPSVGVLILSSKQQPYDKARGASVGADEFHDKPFDTQQLLDKTGALLRKLADQPPAAARPAAPAPAPAPAPAAPAPSPKPPVVQPRPAAPALGLSAPRPHVQTLVGAPAAQPAAPAPVPASAPAAAAAATAGNGQFAERLAGLGLSKEQVDGVLALSREVVEQVVWEVVPTLAETIIKEEIRRLTAE